jgi:predicted dehydrogenase
MSLDRREFVKGSAGLGLALGLSQAGKTAANDRINVAVVGMGGRGNYHANILTKFQEEGTCQVVAVCDVYQKRVNAFKKRFNCFGSLDYREVVSRKDVDAVVVTTPDHWHAGISLAAMDAGKDVYVEKPMTHTIEEARLLVDKVKETKRILQVGSQTTSAAQWHLAKKAMAEGMIGQMIMSQGSYHRNSIEGEWNTPNFDDPQDPSAGPNGKGEDYIDWKRWLGPAPMRPFDSDRFFRFRKYWDYSGGIATDLFYHVIAPLNVCWSEPQFPYKVMAGGGICVFKDQREVPDTFHLIAEYKQGHSVVLSSSMANAQHIPGLIRGHEGSIIMVEHGQFERYSPNITVRPEQQVVDAAYKAKWGTEDIKIAVPQENVMRKHYLNFFECMRTREKPTLDVHTGACAQVLVSMSVQSYREGQTLYFDQTSWKVHSKPPKA